MRIASRPLLVLSALALGLSVPSCTQLARVLYRPPSIAECPGPIPPSSELAGDFSRRLRVHVESDDVSEGYQIVLQKRGDELTVVALTRYGARAFSIVQVGDHVSVESAMKPLEPVPPVNLLRDLYRWPLSLVETPKEGPVRLLLEPERDAATLVNEPCGYRTSVVVLGE